MTQGRDGIASNARPYLSDCRSLIDPRDRVPQRSEVGLHLVDVRHPIHRHVRMSAGRPMQALVDWF
jgi:hypothetical protein